METEKTTALMVVEPPKTKGAMVLRDALREATEQKAILKEYVTHHMVKKVDYGEIPGTDKPTLLKPGAEKLVELFRCTPKFALIKCEEDFEKGFFNYQFRVRIYSRDADAVLAEGFGSANSKEGRYRWRNANRKCPSCGKEAIIKGKEEFGGGWLCFKKKGGCGAKFGTGDKAIEGQAQGQVENDDIATLANTILKMAKKRALVDGAIALARCSDLFTQDVEDLEHPEEAAPPSQPPPQTRPATAEQKPEARPEPKKTEKPKQDPALRNRGQRLWIAARAKGATQAAFQAWTARILGKSVSSALWDAADMDRLESIQPPDWKAAPPATTSNEPPPPSDDDAPPEPGADG